MNKKILDKVFKELSKYEIVSVLTAKEKREYDYRINLSIWEVNTEILLDNKVVSIQLHILFTKEFPLTFPKVFLSPSSYETINNLPHIDTNRFVCTFDTEVPKPNPSEPFGVTFELIKKAKSIIEQGLKKENFADFEEEFISYWENKYEKEKDFPTSILLLFDNENSAEKINLIKLNTKIGSYRYVLHNENKESDNFIKYLKSFGIEYTTHNVFYLSNINYKNKPPFNLTNIESIRLVEKNNSVKELKRFINSVDYPKLVILSKNIKNDIFYFGWFYQSIKTDLKGFRPGKFKAFDWISSIGKQGQVKRISTEKYTVNRLMNRSSGHIIKKNHSFSLVGIGSIGSNLIPLLNSIDYPEFRLIDKDILKLENIARHFLGFDFLGLNKAKAIGYYIKQSNPIQNVLVRENSIIDTISDEPEFINNSEFLFVAIGDSNIESWIGEKIKLKEINIPTFFIWVEPYLTGGHCLYINPNDDIHYQTFFENDYFKYNVIAKSSYDKDLNVLSMKEAGCQTTFTPYSSSNITSFLTSLYLKITKIIDNKATKSSSFTWIGDLTQIDNLGIKLSNNILRNRSGEIFEN